VLTLCAGNTNMESLEAMLGLESHPLH